MALIATFRWPTRSGAASAAPSAALSGSQPKAPGFAGGYLPSTTLADLLMPLLAADPFSAVWASLRWWPSDEFEDGLAHRW